MNTLPPDQPGMSEIQIQSKAYQYLYNNYPVIRGLIFHVPNGEQRNVITGMQLKASGVVPGIPDLLLAWKGRLHYIEVKKPGGYCSTAQKAIHKIWSENEITGVVAFTSIEIVYFVVSIINTTTTP